MLTWEMDKDLANGPEVLMMWYIFSKICDSWDKVMHIPYKSCMLWDMILDAEHTDTEIFDSLQPVFSRQNYMGCN